MRKEFSFFLLFSGGFPESSWLMHGCFRTKKLLSRQGQQFLQCILIQDMPY